MNEFENEPKYSRWLKMNNKKLIFFSEIIIQRKITSVM